MNDASVFFFYGEVFQLLAPSNCCDMLKYRWVFLGFFFKLTPPSATYLGKCACWHTLHTLRKLSLKAPILSDRLLGDKPSQESMLTVFTDVYMRHWGMGVLQWRRNGHDGVLNHQPLDCILNRLLGADKKKTSKLRIPGLCVGNSPVIGEFPAQRASNAENVSIWWCHHVGWWVGVGVKSLWVKSNLLSWILISC